MAGYWDQFMKTGAIADYLTYKDKGCETGAGGDASGRASEERRREQDEPDDSDGNDPVSDSHGGI